MRDGDEGDEGWGWEMREGAEGETGWAQKL